MIPPDEDGYAVDVATRRVHTRYGKDAVGLHRTRTAAGVGVLLKGARPLPCLDCYPYLRRAKKP